MMIWGISSAGRAPALHAGGQRFDPVILHHIFSDDSCEVPPVSLPNTEVKLTNAEGTWLGTAWEIR